MDPIAKLIDSAPKIAAGESLELENGKKTNVDDLTGAFNLMTNELRENLKEVKNKSEIELFNEFYKFQNNVELNDEQKEYIEKIIKEVKEN